MLSVNNLFALSTAALFGFGSIAARAQVEPTVPAPVEFEASFQESDFDSKPWLRDLQFLVVINKADEGTDKQTLKIFSYGQPVNVETIEAYILNYGSKESRKKISQLRQYSKDQNTFLVSTGREAFEPKGSHGAQKDSWTTTPSGYFYPQYFAKKHRSSSYSKKGCGGIFGKIAGAILGKEMCAVMENAVFFNGPIAIHKALPGTDVALGNRASGGCIRLSGPLAEYLYMNIESAIAPSGVPLISNSGQPELDSDGNQVIATVLNSIWGNIQARNAMFIVHNTVVIQQ